MITNGKLEKVKIWENLGMSLTRNHIGNPSVLGLMFKQLSHTSQETFFFKLLHKIEEEGTLPNSFVRPAFPWYNGH